MAPSLSAFVGCFALFGAACAAGFSPSQRAQDAANDYAMAVRFGRMDLAVTQVNRAGRAAFVRQHAAWASGVRVLDCDLVAISMRDRHHADVVAQLSWQRVDESETRLTQLAQRWTDDHGTWLLESEERASGDVGLLGENATAVRPPAERVQFRTITIR